MVKYSKTAESLGAQGLLIVNPYYNKGTQESLVHHYKAAAESSSLPIIVYNVPSRTGMNILPETVCKIADACPTVTAVKEASGNISQIAELIAMLPEKVSVFSGNDDQTLPILALGGKGVISTFSNAFPKEMKSLCEAFFAGDMKKAQTLQKNYLKMMNSLFVEANPIPLKFMMSLLGLCEDKLRLPLMPASKKTQDILSAEYSKLKSNGLLLSSLEKALA
jgi:4-hydroxy-tetrahydrodipicolinate synthase